VSGVHSVQFQISLPVRESKRARAAVTIQKQRVEFAAVVEVGGILTCDVL